MDWTEIARRRHAGAQRSLAADVSASTISVPLGDSDYTAPGFLHLGHHYSCVPDAQYPWDPDVLRAIREIVPDAMPLVIRSVWQWSNYAELGYLAEPMVLVRHGVGRAIRNSFHTLHDFHCDMPSTPFPGLVIPGRDLSACRPNYIETNWHDAADRPYGYDLPGAYVPFSWRLYHAYRQAEDTRQAVLRASRRDENEAGDVVARGAGTASVADEKATVAHRKASRLDDLAHVNRDIDRFYNIPPSDVELKEKALGA